jgi:hypothetical protein
VLHRDSRPTVVLTRSDAEVARFPLVLPACPDLTTVDMLARWQVAAARMGYAIRLRNVGAELTDLLEFVGLRLEVLGQAEVGEEIGVEEVVMPDDPVA